MSGRLFLLAIAALASQAAAAALPPVGDEAGALSRNCDVTLQARNGFTDRAIVIQLSESEVRTRLGTWAKFLVIDRPSLSTISPPSGHGQRRVPAGETVSLTETLPLACNANRRYRLQIVVLRPDFPPDTDRYESVGPYVDQEYTLYHPSADGFTQDPVLQLGDLSRLFPGLEDRRSDAPVASDSPSGDSGDAPGPTGGSAGGGNVAPGPSTWTPPAASEFVPGARTLAAVDLRDVPVGGFPEGLEYVGGAIQVVAHEGRPMLEMDREGTFRVPLPEALPDRFTVEFLYHNPHRFATLLFAPYDPATATRGPSTPHYRPVRAHHFVLSLESTGNGVRPGLGADDLPHAVRVSERHAGAYVDRPVPVQVVVDGELATMFVDGEQVASLPRSTFERAGAVEFYYKGGRGAAYVGDIRVAGDGTGAPSAEPVTQMVVRLPQIPSTADIPLDEVLSGLGVRFGGAQPVDAVLAVAVVREGRVTGSIVSQPIRLGSSLDLGVAGGVNFVGRSDPFVSQPIRVLPDAPYIGETEKNLVFERRPGELILTTSSGGSYEAVVLSAVERARAAGPRGDADALVLMAVPSREAVGTASEPVVLFLAPQR